MHYYQTLPRFMLGLPLSMRLIIAFGTLLLCIIVFLMVPEEAQNPYPFVVAIITLAWLLKWEVFWLISLGLFSFFVYHLIGVRNDGSIIIPLDLFISYGFSCLAVFFLGWCVAVQRREFIDVEGDLWFYVDVLERQQKHYQVKDQFLQNVNHELRTPLTAICGYLDLLLEHNDQLDADLRKAFLENAQQNCEELQLIVNNVLDSMSENKEKEKRPELPAQQIVVFDLVHDVLEQFDPQTIRDHIITVDVPSYIVIDANPQYTRQVLRNLLSNAFKYAPVGTTIEISADLYGNVVSPRHPSPEICICVQDHGPGIAKEDQSKLFKQFVRLHREEFAGIRGSGLGLYLSKQFVEQMNGRIWIESNGIRGEGSRFCFTLPCVPRPKVKSQIQQYSVYVPTAMHS